MVEQEVEKRSYIFDITKAKKELGYSPKYSYEDAMRDYKKEMESGRFIFHTNTLS